MGRHTIEKIGGTSMSQFGSVMETVIIGNRKPEDIYNRGFVVSAYGGITDMLLEHKKSGQPGVYRLYAANDPTWKDALSAVANRMCQINEGFVSLGLDLAEANRFVKERIEGIRSCLKDLRRLASYGHFQLVEQFPAVREMLSAVGEAHSAYNSTKILQHHGINALFVDLTGWMEEENLPFNEKIDQAFHDVDFSVYMPIITGYTKCAEGIMSTFDRGYSEITFAKIAVRTKAREAVIQKEFHLSSGDPKLIGVDKVKVIGQTNYDVADQLADMGMEAIHPRASKGLEYNNIPLRVRNAFDPDHPGTLITKDFRSESPRVEMVTGRAKMVAIEVWDPDMVGQSGYDHKVVGYLAKHGISYIGKNTNANTITHYVSRDVPGLDACVADMRKAFEHADVNTYPMTLVSAIGSNMKVPGFLSKAANALAEAQINILAIGQCMRQVNMQFVIADEDFENAIKALHRGLVER